MSFYSLANRNRHYPQFCVRTGHCSLSSSWTALWYLREPQWPLPLLALASALPSSLSKMWGLFLTSEGCHGSGMPLRWQVLLQGNGDGSAPLMTLLYLIRARRSQLKLESLLVAHDVSGHIGECPESRGCKKWVLPSIWMSLEMDPLQMLLHPGQILDYNLDRL